MIGPAHFDQLERTLGIDRRKPGVHEAMERAAEWFARLIERPCSEGRCVELIDPETGENTGGWGPVGFPCQD